MIRNHLSCSLLRVVERSLRNMGSFGQSDQIEERPAHSQTDEEELWDELKKDEDQTNN